LHKPPSFSQLIMTEQDHRTQIDQSSAGETQPTLLLSQNIL